MQMKCDPFWSIMSIFEYLVVMLTILTKLEGKWEYMNISDILSFISVEQWV